MMRAPGSPVRTWISLLLACTLPWCCCNFRTLLGGGLSCQTAALRLGHPGESQVMAGTDHAPARPTCCHGPSASQGAHPESNPQHTPADHPKDCPCGQAGGKMLAAEKSNVEAPAEVVVAVLEQSRRRRIQPHELAGGRGRVGEAFPRPLTSLVRMHCALIV